jgi:signal peptidase I
MAKEEQLTGKQIALEWIKDILIAVIIAVIIIQFIKPTIVKESSMEPNFYENDYLFVYKMAYHSKLPKKGDVVIFRSDLTQDGKKKLLIKRVIGLPGDVITIKDGDVYINGENDDQSYTADGYTSDTIIDHKVPEGTVFCMGDNREVSIDSRSPEVGDVDTERLVGKVVFRAFPFNKFGVIHNPYDEEGGR